MKNRSLKRICTCMIEGSSNIFDVFEEHVPVDKGCRSFWRRVMPIDVLNIEEELVVV